MISDEGNTGCRIESIQSSKLLICQLTSDRTTQVHGNMVETNKPICHSELIYMHIGVHGCHDMGKLGKDGGGEGCK